MIKYFLKLQWQWNNLQVLTIQRSILVTYPETVASSDTETLWSRTKLLVEVDDLIDELLANIALKLFIVAKM